ncbi:MAG: hypothetical protein V4773_20330 [Verrucomicrobiota bacterium]
MIRSLRAYFLSRALREKLLLFAFVAIGLLWWLSSFSTRAGGFWRQQRTTTANLEEQALWIKNKTKIEETAQTAAAQLDAAKTLRSNELAATLLQLANDAGLKNASLSGQPTTVQNGQFAIHTAAFTIRNGSWEAIQTYYTALQQKVPYIAVEQFALQSVPGGQGQDNNLTLSLRAESFQVVR